MRRVEVFSSMCVRIFKITFNILNCSFASRNDVCLQRNEELSFPWKHLALRNLVQSSQCLCVSNLHSTDS